MKDLILNTINKLILNKHVINGKNVTIGFDGFIDNIYRIVYTRKENDISYFKTMSNFGSYINDKKGKSCTIEIINQTVKIGGNMPIMALALGNLGVNVNCIGAMGYPIINEKFNVLERVNCNLFSISEPGITNALEFNDGKVMLSEMNMLENITWEHIKKIIGINNLCGLITESNIIGLVNWSEILHSNDVWEGIILDVLPMHTPNKSQIMFFDLADCSKKDDKEIKYALDLIQKFSKHFKTVIGLNENECYKVATALQIEYEENNLLDAGDKTYGKLEVDNLIVHTRDRAISWDETGRNSICSFFTENPKLSTGGGDNFNAGICLSLLMGFDIKTTLVTANASSGYYIRKGKSADIGSLINFLRQEQNNL